MKLGAGRQGVTEGGYSTRDLTEVSIQVQCLLLIFALIITLHVSWQYAKSPCFIFSMLYLLGIEDGK